MCNKAHTKRYSLPCIIMMLDITEFLISLTVSFQLSGLISNGLQAEAANFLQQYLSVAGVNLA